MDCKLLSKPIDEGLRLAGMLGALSEQMYLIDD